METATAEMVMFPCFMPVPNNLRSGDVVVHIDSGDRGIVTSDPHSVFGDVSITLSASVGVVTNNPEGLWLRLPRQEWTVEERVRSVALAAPVEFEDRPDDEFQWDLLRSMLDDDEFEDLYPDAEWPNTVAMAKAVARKLDRLRAAAAGTEPPTVDP